MKRLFDIAFSLVLLPVFLTILLVLVVLNPLLNKGPLFFVQNRMGLDCVAFRAIKFRSMLPVEGVTRSADDPIEQDRISPLGELMRKTRIDELPQILNVLVGEMSLIGPRPDFIDHAREYARAIPKYAARHTVRPGISGLAQVSLGYASGYTQTRAKAAADLIYIRNAGFGLDMKIFWLTLVTVFMRHGA